jgi:hypothetical protein
MKKGIYIVCLFCGILTQQIVGQNCSATFIYKMPQCNHIFSNMSDPSWQFKWTVNGSVFYKKDLEFPRDAFETFNVCLYTYDSVNNCRDTICKTVKGLKKLKFDYYIYKQQFYATANLTGSKEAVFLMVYGDNIYGSSYVTGVFKHTYINQGTYKLVLYMFDTLKMGTTVKHCRIDSDTANVVIDGSAQCHSYFMSYKDTSVKDSVFLFNRSAGEHLKYYWDLGDATSSTKKFPVHKYAVAKKVKICLTIEDTVKQCINTYCDSLDVIPGLYLQTVDGIDPGPGDTTTSINRLVEEHVSIYPNPFNKSITIRLPELDSETQWEITGIDGRRIISGTFPALSTSNTIDLEMLRNGLYLIILGNDHTSMTLKLIKN